MYNMQGLSFREYLQLFHQITVPALSLVEIIGQKAELPGVKHPLPLFADYLKRGYYPFALQEDFDLKLQQVINQTLETDIPMYAGMISQLRDSTGGIKGLGKVDNIELGYLNTIPLWQFGLTY